MRRSALLAAALVLSGCLTALPVSEPARSRAALAESPGLLAPAWPQEHLPTAPTPFDDLVNATLALKASPRVTMSLEGHSGQGRPLLSILVAEGDPAGKPLVLLLGSQHGNEPAGSDAALLLATYYAWGGDAARKQLEQFDLAVLLCANPDGRVADKRENATGVDINRDHMDLHSPEARSIHAALDRLAPQVVLDLHQFGSTGADLPPRSAGPGVVFEIGGPQDPLVYPGILAASDRLASVAAQAVQQDFGADAVGPYPVTDSSQDASIARNHYAMHNAMSLLFEAKRPLANYSAEVRLHLSAVSAVLAQVAADPKAPLAAQAEARHEATPRLAKAYLAPPQAALANFSALLQAHGLNATLSAQALARPAVALDPRPDAVRSDFPNGTLVVPLDQREWRTASEMLESWSGKDAHYTEGPRDVGLAVWRALS